MGVVFLEGRAKTAPMLIKNEPVAMEVQQLTALPPQEYVPRSREPPPQSWADIMEESDGQR